MWITHLLQTASRTSTEKWWWVPKANDSETGPGRSGCSLRLILPFPDNAWPYPMLCGHYNDFYLVSHSSLQTWLQRSTLGKTGKGHSQFDSSFFLPDCNLLVTANDAWKVLRENASLCMERRSPPYVLQKRLLSAAEALKFGFSPLLPSWPLFLDNRLNQNAASKQMGRLRFSDPWLSRHMKMHTGNTWAEAK